MSLNRACILAALLAGLAWPQSADLAPVVSKTVSRNLQLPGEFQPFLSVSLHSRVQGFVERVLVDRGSLVKEGDLLVELSAPEMQARIAEAQSRVLVAESERIQAEAQLASAQNIYDRLKKASETPGAISGNELDQAAKQVDAGQALVRAKQESSHAAEAVVRAQQELLSYLKITAPFDGMVTERIVHPGALAGPDSAPLLVIQQISNLRLVVAVPEESVGGIMQGAKVEFQVPAFPGRTFTGKIARSAHALDEKTRTMPVELDVVNTDGSLSPGMYPTVKWPVRQSRPALFVPKTSVVTTTERTFVVRDQNGHAEWVDVKKGALDGDLVEIIGSLRPGDMVVRRATDELRDGTPLPVHTK